MELPNESRNDKHPIDSESEEPLQCIAATEEGRCPNFAKSKYFCDVHLEHCNKLHDKYKRSCTIAQENGRVIYRDIENLNIEQLIEYIDVLNKHYSLNNRCINDRSSFKEDCVNEECEDDGHRHFYSQFPEARNEIEALILQANTRLTKLEREASFLSSRKGKTNKEEKKFKPQPKKTSRSPDGRPKKSSRSPDLEIDEIELERIKLANQKEQEAIYQRRLELFDEILGIINAIPHPNYENLTYDMNVLLNFNLLMSFHQNLINSKLVDINVEVFETTLKYSENNTPAVSAKTIAPFYNEYPNSILESLLNLMKTSPWWLCRISILGCYISSPGRVDYEPATEKLYKDKAKDRSIEKQRLAKRLMLLIKLSKDDLKNKVLKMRNIIMKIDDCLMRVAHRQKSFQLGVADISELSKEEQEKYKFMTGKVSVQSDKGFNDLEIFFYEYFNIPEIEFMITHYK